MAFNILRLLSGGRAMVTEVLFSVRKPQDAQPQAQFFGLPVRFDQALTGLVLQHASLDVQVIRADAAAFAAIRREAAALLRDSRQAWTGRVARALRGALAIGSTGRAEIAAHLGLHRRAMARRLAKEGTSFQAQVDGARHHAARELLALTHPSMGDSALSVGCQNPAAFRRRGGTTPGGWRAALASRRPAAGPK